MEEKICKHNIMCQIIELTCIFVTIKSQQKLMKMDAVTEVLTMKSKKQKVIEQELNCKFIRINFSKEDFDIFRAINEIFRQIKQSTQKTVIKKNSMR